MNETVKSWSSWVREPRRFVLPWSMCLDWLKNNPRRGLILGGGLVIAAFLSGAVVRSRISNNLLLASVSEGVFEVQIVESGTLQALRSVTYSSSIPGSQAKILEIIPEGSQVSVGDVLVQFDKQPFVEVLDQSNAQLAQAEAELIKAREEENLLQIAAKEEIVESRGKVRLAELELQSVIGGKGKLAEAESAAHLAQAKRELEKVRGSYEDLKPLLEEGFITKLELDRAAQAVQKAQEDLRILEIKHQTYMEYTRPAEVEGSRVGLSNSKESLRQSERTNTFRFSQARASLELARSKYAELISRVEVQGENLNRCEILATVDGLVIYREVFFGSEKRKVQVGDQVWPNQPLIMLPDLSQMTIETQVREIDIHKVKKGQQVIIGVDAYPEIILNGKVSFIGTLAQEDVVRRGGKYFNITILIENTDSRLRPGMSARAELLVDRVEEALYVPLEAVFERGGKHYSYVMRGKSPKIQEVLVGPSNENHIVIEAGLESSDRVVLIGTNESHYTVGEESFMDFLGLVSSES